MRYAQFGMIGLGTMGRNFLLNVGEKGISGIGFDLDPEKRKLLLDEGVGCDLRAAESLDDFLSKLERPRRVMILVPANAVDRVIDDLVERLEVGDIVIDGGNSHFPDTERREARLTALGVGFLGVGVSGGEEGARHGASIMAGGISGVYELVRPVLDSAAARVGSEPCAAFVGNGSAGHFVKMVHNGIEYGLMQLIAEAYDLMKRGFAMTNEEIADRFGEWNRADLNGFLIEITEAVLRKKDPETGADLVDMILDTAGQKGTGKWTSQAASDLGVPIPTIDSAVSMRQLSSRWSERIAASASLGVIKPRTIDGEMRDDAVEFLRRGLHLAFVVTYAQGMALLQAASDEKDFELDMVEIAKIWRGGCIIRAALLEDIRKAFAAQPTLSNLLLSEAFRETVRANHEYLKATVINAVSCDVASMAFAASLNYLNAFATERLPANLIQAQRDLFGAHTYQRTDRDGTFHTPDWNI
ncbi:MAG: NADP-dependent phosphogluconate dehydrogenase [Acidobacteria bacterium]|nr:NADP-dependent phosphogluconate dehydrogenase [Acidobacteriota bacterium]